MARQGINTGTSPNDGLGDSLLAGAIKVNSNFSEIYNTFGNGNTLNPIIGYANTAGIATVAQGLTGTPSIDVYRLGISSSINVGAASTFQKSVHFESTLLIGDADELQIFHDGNNSYIDNASAGNLILRDSGTGIQLKKTSGALMGVFNNDAGVELYYNGVLKFQTFQNGVAINESVGIGSTAGNPPYRLTVSGVGATITQGLTNAIADFTSSVNGYGQLNVRNSLSGTNASGDIVVTSNTGNDTSNFIDLGINNTGFTTSSWTINGALDGYLYTSDGNLSIGAASATKYLSLFAGGTLAENEQVRVTTTGVGIGTTNATSKLTVSGDVIVSGVTTFQNSVYLGDNDFIYFGDSSDLYIGHNGSVSAIADAGTGDLYIAGDNSLIITDLSYAENKAKFNTNGSVELYYDNSKKFETSGVGVTITGTTFTNQLNVSGVVTATSFVGNGSGLTDVPGSGLNPIAISGRYYFPWGMFPDTAGTRVVTSGRVYYYAFVCTKTTTWTRIGTRISSGVSGTARLGIYAVGSTGLPTTLLQDFGTVSTSISGEKEITISYQMNPGTYYLALVSSAAATFTGYFLDARFMTFMYGLSSPTVTVATSLWYETSSGDTLPSTANTTLTEEDTSLRRPQIFLRVV